MSFVQLGFVFWGSLLAAVGFLAGAVGTARLARLIPRPRRIMIALVSLLAAAGVGALVDAINASTTPPPIQLGVLIGGAFVCAAGLAWAWSTIGLSDQTRALKTWASAVAHPTPDLLQLVRSFDARHQLLAQALEHFASPAVAVLLDPRGHVVVYANAKLCRALGYEPDALNGRDLADLVHPDDVARHGDAMLPDHDGEPVDVALRSASGGWLNSRLVGGYRSEASDLGFWIVTWA